MLSYFWFNKFNIFHKVVLIKYHQLLYFNKQGLAGIYSLLNTQYFINHSENNWILCVS